MRIRSLRRLRFWSRQVIAACLVVIVAYHARPWVAGWIYQDEYRKLTLECDLAMHDEAALRAGTAGAANHPLLETSGAVGLAVCHQYDKLQKKMLILGVSEERLALLGLEALEADQIPVGRMVDPHRMERF